MALLEKRVEEGTVPASLLKRPVLFEDLFPIWNAFYFLSKYRPVYDMGFVGMIPLSELQVYMNMQGMVDEEQCADFVELIGIMDSAYVDFTVRKRSKGK